jgi:hypothetical protein
MSWARTGEGKERREKKKRIKVPKTAPQKGGQRRAAADKALWLMFIKVTSKTFGLNLASRLFQYLF